MLWGEQNVLAGTTWDFSKGAEFPGGEAGDNACLLRYDGDLESTRLLIELAYVAKLGSGIDVTISCGWTQVRLNGGGGGGGGSSMAWDMHLHGGTPFETGVAIETLEPDAVIRTKSAGSGRRRYHPPHQPPHQPPHPPARLTTTTYTYTPERVFAM